MSIVCDEEELVEDRFDDQTFEDAPLSDVESNFDEEDLRSIEQNGQLAPFPQEYPQYCPNSEWNRPALSTIPEESKIDDIPTSEISRRSPFTIRSTSDGQSSSGEELSITRALSIKSSEFITDQKASEIIAREQESFMRGHGRFIPDDPRFNRSHFEKENSWEPSIVDQSSFETAQLHCSALSLPLPQGDDRIWPQPIECCASGGDNVVTSADDIEQVQCRIVTPTEGDVGRETALSNLTNKPLNEDKFPSNSHRATPQRIQVKPLKSLTTNDSPILNSDSTVGAAQTSTPVSVVAKLTSRVRRLELAENFHGVSMILPEGESLKEVPSNQVQDEPSLADVTNNTTVISVGKIQSILKSQPASSSPRTLMKVLDEYKKDRIKARKVRSTLPPPPRNASLLQNTASLHRDAVSTKALDNNTSAQNRTADITKPAISSNSAAFKPSARDAPMVTLPHESSQPNISRQQGPLSNAQEKVTIEEIPNSRPCSARSSSSLSTNGGVRSSSQMSTDVAKRSVLYIPQLEVAFGFVALGDAAVFSVEVTNRKDHSLRLRAKLSHPGPPFTLLDSQIFVLDGHRTAPLRIEFSPTQNARFCNNLLISVEGGGGPQVKYRMPVRGTGGVAVVTVKARDDLRISRNGSYILQSSYESTFSFALTNSGNRRAFSRIVVLCTSESNIPEHLPVDVRPAPGIVIDRGETKHISVRLRAPLPSSDWRSSQNSLVSTASTSQPRTANQLQVIVYWGEERTRQRLRCFEKMTGAPHICEGLQFTDTFVGEDPTFCPPEDYPISKEDVRLFDQTLRMCTIYVCSPRIRPRPSLVSNPSTSLERSLQPEDTFREKSTYRVVIPDQTLR